MNKIRVIFLIVILSFFLTGCWDSTETEKLGVVTLMGIGLDSDNNIEVMIQETGEKNNCNYEVFKESAPSVSQAVEKIALNQHHRIYFGHTKVVILSEELATTKGLVPVIDFFQREGEIRPTSRILISKSDQLNKILSTNLGLNSDTGTILEETIKNKKNSPNIIATNIKDFIELLSTPGREIYTSGIALKNRDIDQGNKNEIFDFGDIAVFKDEKMIDWLKGDEARGFLWIKGNAKGSLITVSFENGNISSKIIHVKSKIKPLINNDKMNMDIAVKVSCNMEESQCVTDFMDESVINKIEEAQNQKIKNEINAALNKAKQLKTDIFGLGYYLYADYPGYTNDDYKVNVTVDSTIRNIRIYYKPVIKQ
ncbi:MAG: Ger(x)C family spore germination protein [Solirubrobacterales bacterium]